MREYGLKLSDELEKLEIARSDYDNLKTIHTIKELFSKELLLIAGYYYGLRKTNSEIKFHYKKELINIWSNRF